MTYDAVPVSALWEVVTYLELSPEMDRTASEHDPTHERVALIDALLQWGAEQKERRLALASKLEWESYKHVEDLSTLTDEQEAERVACERCGFIFKMYHADSWFSEIADMARKLVRLSPVPLLPRAAWLPVKRKGMGSPRVPSLMWRVSTSKGRAAVPTLVG